MILDIIPFQAMMMMNAKLQYKASTVKKKYVFTLGDWDCDITF